MTIDYSDADDLAQKALALGSERLVRAVCPDAGCLVGWLVETPVGPVWVPEDKRFDPKAVEKLGPGTTRVTGRVGPYSEVVLTRTEHYRPIHLDARPDHPLQLAVVIGSCRHGARDVDVVDMLRKRPKAIHLKRPDKTVARRPSDPR